MVFVMEGRILRMLPAKAEQLSLSVTLPFRVKRQAFGCAGALLVAARTPYNWRVA